MSVIAPKIVRVLFHGPIPMGKGMEAFRTLAPSEHRIDGKSFTVIFDADTRFLRFKVDSFVQLVPLSNVQSVQIEG